MRRSLLERMNRVSNEEEKQQLILSVVSFEIAK
jgi:hypothetical protein